MSKNQFDYERMIYHKSNSFNDATNGYKNRFAHKTLIDLV